VIGENERSPCTTRRKQGGPRHIFRPQHFKPGKVLPYDTKSGAFSAAGDSGAVIVNGLGRNGGLLTGGTNYNLTASSDITYATPITFIIGSIKRKFPNARLT
jgi:hypothetical protein